MQLGSVWVGGLPQSPVSCINRVLPALVRIDMATWSRSLRLLQLISVVSRGKGSALGPHAGCKSIRYKEPYVRIARGARSYVETYSRG